MQEESSLLVKKVLSKEFDLSLFDDDDAFLHQLASRINLLIQNDFIALINILYRIDVSESKLKNTLREHQGENAGYLMANLIIERQLQKIKSREESRQNLHPGDGDERW